VSPEVARSYLLALMRGDVTLDPTLALQATAVFNARHRAARVLDRADDGSAA
jgi:hypothetical protein